MRLIYKSNYTFSYRNFGKLSYDPFEKTGPPKDASNLK
jgi:hypothetical protein